LLLLLLLYTTITIILGRIADAIFTDEVCSLVGNNIIILVINKI